MTNSDSGAKGSPVEQSANIYDDLMLLRLEEAKSGSGAPLTPGEWREFRQRIRDVGVVDGARTDETADLIRAAMGADKGKLPPIDTDDDEAARDEAARDSI